MVPGTSLGHYRVLRPLGKGGMGEVYAAEDTRLNRTVALKILPATMAADPERRVRFEREAQAVASLNHPNIVTIHSVEEAAGVMFLTLEAVDGRTLGEMMSPGGLPLDTLLRIGIAISDAMAAAHQRGITHRDLKPANVMVTPDGRVKVLDFGLAKLHEAEREALGEEQTRLGSSDVTGEGRIVGTVAYMSPEQAEGKPVDPRSDIFSAGVMLHEMAAGERPFKGDTNVAVISSILKETPSSITDLKPELPAGLARIVRRCLAKDPARRYQTATDLRNDLEELKHEVDSGVTASTVRRQAARKPKRWKLLAAGVATAVVAAAALAAWLALGSDTAPAAAAFTAERFTRLTESGLVNLAALSRDGRYVVHVKVQDAKTSIWVRQTATTSDVQIVDPSDARIDGLTFSPDGNYVYYVAYPLTQGVANLYRVPALGGSPTRVIEDIDGAPAFSPDGRSFAFVRGEVTAAVNHLMVAAADGGGVRKLASGSDSVQFANEAPSWSPDGRTIVLTATQTTLRYVVAAVDVATGAARLVGEPWIWTRNVQWMPDGRSLIIDGVDSITANPQLWQVGYPGGERRRVTNDLSRYLGVSLSEDGTLLATVQSDRQASIWLIPAGQFEGRELSIPARSAGVAGMAWTPDGRLVFTADTAGLRQLWIAAADGSNARQLTSAQGFAADPAVSPDGASIYYTLTTAEDSSIWRMGIDGSNPRQVTSGVDAFRPIPSPDARFVYFTSLREGANRAMKVALDGGAVTPVSDAWFAAAGVSDDGTELIGAAWNDARQRSECATLATSGEGGVRLLGDVPVATGGLPQTCRFLSGKSSISYVAYRDGVANVFAQSLAGGPERALTRFTRDAAPQIFAGASSSDGRVAMSRGSATSDVVLISTK